MERAGSDGRDALRERIVKAARAVPLRLGPNAVAMAQRGEPIILNMSEADDLADEVLAVLPEQTDRATLLREAIARVEDPEERAKTTVGLGLGWESARDVLRRMLAVVSVPPSVDQAAPKPRAARFLDALTHSGPGYDTSMPAVSPSVVVSADRATLRDRIADIVMPFLLNFSDEESARINAAEVATALLAVLPAPEAVCICGHSKQQHFEDACITETTGCNCGDYLEPQDAAEVIDRWRQAALQARAADRATLLRAADWFDSGVRSVTMLFGHQAATELRRMADQADADASRVAAEEQPTETQWPGERCGLCPPGTRTRHLEDHMVQVHGARPTEQPAETQDDTDLTEADIDRMLTEGVPVQIVTAPPATHGAQQRPAVAEQPDTQTREAS